MEKGWIWLGPRELHRLFGVMGSGQKPRGGLGLVWEVGVRQEQWGPPS